MAKRDDERPRKRFSRSGHTTHGPRVTGDAAPPPYRPEQRYAPPDPGYGPAPDRSPYGESGSYRSGEVPPDRYSDYPPPRYGPPQYGPPPPAPPNQYGPPTYRQVPGADSHHPAESYDSPDEHSRGIARAAFTQTNRAARLVTRKVISASKADGAQESGPDRIDLEPGAQLRHRRDDRGGAGRHRLLRRIAACATGQHPALPTDHDGAVRRGRAGDRTRAGPVAARPALDDGGHRARPRRARADHGEPPERAARALPVRTRVTGVVQGLRGGSCRGRPQAGPAESHAHRGQRPAVHLRPRIDPGRGFDRRHPDQGDGLVFARADTHRDRLSGLRVLRVPAAPAGRFTRCCGADLE